MGKKSSLPKRGTEEADRLVSLYSTAPGEQLYSLADQYGYATKNSFANAMLNMLGAKRRKPKTEAETKEEPKETIVYQPYPEFKIKPYPVIKSRDKEEVVIVLTDAHVGKKTENYNLAIYKKRMGKLLDKVMTVIQLHRPIGKAYIFDLGDNIQGENVYQGSKIGDTEVGAWEQINDYAVPTLSDFIVSLKQGVESVDFYGVPGNHGNISKESTTKTNWDNFIYKGLEVALTKQEGINIHCPTEFYQLITILGYKFFIFHGDQVRSSQGIPLFALRRKLQEWYAYVGGFDYAYCGHWHTWGADSVNSRADYQICPPLVTGDSWALEKVGRASMPIQLIFGIHPKVGRTWEYKLSTDDKFSLDSML